jgi:penicillin-binding protein 1C
MVRLPNVRKLKKLMLTSLFLLFYANVSLASSLSFSGLVNVKSNMQESDVSKLDKVQKTNTELLAIYSKKKTLRREKFEMPNSGLYVDSNQNLFVATKLRFTAYQSSNHELWLAVIKQEHESLYQDVDVLLYNCNLKPIKRSLEKIQNGFLKFTKILNTGCKKNDLFVLIQDKQDQNDRTLANISEPVGMEKWKQPVHQGESKNKEKFDLDLISGLVYEGEHVYINLRTPIKKNEGLYFLNLATHEKYFLRIPQNTPINKIIRTKLNQDIMPGTYSIGHKAGANTNDLNKYFEVLKKKVVTRDVFKINIENFNETGFLSKTPSLKLTKNLSDNKKYIVKTSISIRATNEFKKLISKTDADEILFPIESEWPAGCGFSGSRVWIKDTVVSDEKNYKIDLPALENCHLPVQMFLTVEIFLNSEKIQSLNNKNIYYPLKTIPAISVKSAENGMYFETIIFNLSDDKVESLKNSKLNFIKKNNLEIKYKLTGDGLGLRYSDYTLGANPNCKKNENTFFCDHSELKNADLVEIRSSDYAAYTFKKNLRENANQTNFFKNRFFNIVPTFNTSSGESNKTELLVETNFKKYGLLVFLENKNGNVKAQHFILNNPSEKILIDKDVADKNLALSAISYELGLAENSFISDETKWAMTDINQDINENAQVVLKVEDITKDQINVIIQSKEDIKNILLFAIADKKYSTLKPENIFNFNDYKSIQKNSLFTNAYLFVGRHNLSTRDYILGGDSVTDFDSVIDYGDKDYIIEAKKVSKLEGATKYSIDINPTEMGLQIFAKIEMQSGNFIYKSIRQELAHKEDLKSYKKSQFINAPLASGQAKNESEKKISLIWNPESSNTKIIKNKYLEYLTKQNFNVDTNPSDNMILDKNKYLLGLKRINFSKRQFDWVSAESTSKALVQLLIEAEDKNFFQHKGVDWPSLGNATAHYILKGNDTKRGGASTLTMQVINLSNENFKNKKKSLLDKSTQIQLALDFEKEFSKQEILDIYLNSVPLRGEVIGLQTGALMFFGKHPRDLNRIESAILVAMIPSPNTSYENLVRRACTHLNRSECGVAKNVSLNIMKNYENTSHRFSEFNIADEELIKIDGENSAFSKTNIDADLQAKVQKVLNSHIKSFADQNLKEGAVVVIDNKNQETIVYVGNITDANITNRLYTDNASALKQPGSVLKPLVYAFAFDEKKFNINTVISDNPTYYLNDKYEIYEPKNFNLKYHGVVTAGEALGSSLNIPATKIYSSLNEKNLFLVLRKLGLKNLDPNQKIGPSFVLGSKEVSLHNLTKSYSNAFYNNGFSKLTSEQIKFILSSSHLSRLQFGYLSMLNLPYNYSIKTGISNYSRDQWAIAFNDSYTLGVWVGNSDRSVPWSIGSQNAARLMQKIILSVDKFQINNLNLNLSTDSFKSNYFEEKKSQIKFPISQMSLLSESNKSVQKILIEPSEQNEDLIYSINDNPTKKTNINTLEDAILGKNIIKVFNSDGTVKEKFDFFIVN